MSTGIRRFFVVRTLVLLAWCAVGTVVRGQTPLAPDLRVRPEGSWTPGGVYPVTEWQATAARAADPARRPRTWGSWSGSDAGTGTLTLGPFRVPAGGRFVVAVAGYPARAGNEVFLRRTADGARHVLANFNPHEFWVEVLVEPPAGWVGREAELVATDGATGGQGWLGVSEPYDRGFDRSQRAGLAMPDYPYPSGGFLPAMLAGLALNAAFALAPGLGLLPALRRRVDLPDALAPLLAWGGSAACGYAVFWVYSVHTPTGRAVSWAVTVGSLVGIAWQAARGGRTFWAALGGRETLAAGGLTALAGALYLAMLYLPAPMVPPNLLAERRFSAEHMANDNVIPQTFADRLYRDQEVLPVLVGDWHASDRPPLQTGWQLLARPVVLATLRQHPDLVDQTSGMLFQLAWVPAAWALLRGARLGRRAAGRVVAAVVPTGFLYFNGVYVWPKLGGAALAVGAFTLLLQSGGTAPGRRRQRPTVGQAACAGALAGLGLLAHGAVVFGLFGVAAFLLLPGLFPGWRQTLAGIAAVLALNVPWALYGKFYDPPANRLLKWHLAGVIPIDARPFGQTLRESYAALAPGEAWANKRANLATLLRGNFLKMTSLSPDGSESRRREEFFYLFRALGVWNLGWWAGLLLLGRAAVRRLHPRGGGGGDDPRPSWPAGTRDLALAVGVSVLGTAIWCLLMFGANSAVNHQGSYGPALCLFVCLAAFLEAASPTLFLTVALFNAAAFVATYGPAPAGIAVGSGADPTALATAGIAALGLLAWTTWPGKNRLPTLPGASPFPLA